MNALPPVRLAHLRVSLLVAQVLLIRIAARVDLHLRVVEIAQDPHRVVEVDMITANKIQILVFANHPVKAVLHHLQGAVFLHLALMEEVLPSLPNKHPPLAEGAHRDRFR